MTDIVERLTLAIEQQKVVRGDYLYRGYADQILCDAKSEIQTLRAALQEQRRAVIEECAAVAEQYPSPMNDLPMTLAMRGVAIGIRALATPDMEK